MKFNWKLHTQQPLSHIVVRYKRSFLDFDGMFVLRSRRETVDHNPVSMELNSDTTPSLQCVVRTFREPCSAIGHLCRISWIWECIMESEFSPVFFRQNMSCTQKHCRIPSYQDSFVAYRFWATSNSSGMTKISPIFTFSIHALFTFLSLSAQILFYIDVTTASPNVSIAKEFLSYLGAQGFLANQPRCFFTEPGYHWQTVSYCQR